MKKLTDQEMLDFVTEKGNEVPDHSPSSAALVDDICLNGQRKIQQHERSMIAAMFLRYEKICR
jgi:hypothetical protein